MNKILYIIFLSIIVSNCTFKPVVKHHGVPFLEKKQASLIVNESNTNDIKRILGWELKAEGLCKDNVCVPFSVSDDHVGSEFFDLLQLAETLGFSTVLDYESNFLAIDTFSALRASALSDKKAPDIKLPDIDGNVRFLSEWSDKKKLLVAFSSW